MQVGLCCFVVPKAGGVGGVLNSSLRLLRTSSRAGATVPSEQQSRRVLLRIARQAFGFDLAGQAGSQKFVNATLSIPS